MALTRFKQLIWFIGLWLLGVASITTIGFIIKLFL